MNTKSCASCTNSKENGSPDIENVICTKCSQCSEWELKLLTDQFNEDYTNEN